MAAGNQSRAEIYPVAGVRLSAVRAGIRYPDRLDLVLVELARGSQTAAVFTQNAFCAAPVIVARQHLFSSETRYLLINTGNANAGTGAPGLEAARQSCRAVAGATTTDMEQVLPFSTGVIGEALPVEAIVKAIPECLQNLGPRQWEQAARGIMTTDTRPKIASRKLEIAGKSVAITGFAKGAGMLKPNMATMLAFVFTDAAIDDELLEMLLRAAAERTFNRITVDGDTSTNDACVLSATGSSGVRLEQDSLQADSEYVTALEEVFTELATGLIRDGEGASKFITVRVEQGASVQECLRVAYCVAESPLVKTAFFASDPNWGRILAAVGRAGLADLDIDRVSITLGDTMLVSKGAVDPAYTEAQGQSVMDHNEITVTIRLGRGGCVETVWTSDLSHDYIRINADYRS